MLRLLDIEVALDEKEHVLSFLKNKGYTTQTSYVGWRWWSDDVWKISWYADDLNNHFLELLNYLSDKRQN